MLLLVDAGNSNTKLATAPGGGLGRPRRFGTHAWNTADELEALLDGLLRLDGDGLAAVDRIALASVVPPVSTAIASIAASRGIALVEASPATVPIPPRVDRPAEVGADRLVNALAAARLYGAPAIVVDFGTATTFDAVGADGAYLGGAIAPGIEIGIDALASRTAKLPRIELRKPARAIGRDTVSAMQSGAVYGYIGLARELIARLRTELAAEAGAAYVTVILTGGVSAAPWVREIGGVDAIDPDLTLKGLLLVAEACWGAATAHPERTGQAAGPRGGAG